MKRGPKAEVDAAAALLPLGDAQRAIARAVVLHMMGRATALEMKLHLEAAQVAAWRAELGVHAMAREFGAAPADE